MSRRFILFSGRPAPIASDRQEWAGAAVPCLSARTLRGSVSSDIPTAPQARHPPTPSRSWRAWCWKCRGCFSAAHYTGSSRLKAANRGSAASTFLRSCSVRFLQDKRRGAGTVVSLRHVDLLRQYFSYLLRINCVIDRFKRTIYSIYGKFSVVKSFFL